LFPSHDRGQIKNHLTSAQQAEQQRIQTEVQSELGAFASNPENVHYEQVRGHMAALLREGTATDLKDAYDKACWVHPDIRATLLAAQRNEEEQKRKAEAKTRAEDAKRKGLSITGGPGATGTKPAPDARGLREELQANWDAQSSAV
jgi:hypothetical protein